MANRTSLAIREFQAPIATQEHDSLDVNPIVGQNKFELVRLPKASGIQLELVCLTLADLHSLLPLMLSLPRNDDFKSLLTWFSTRLTNRYLVTRVIQCPPDPRQPSSTITTPLYSVAKPFVWHRNESASSVAEEWSSDESGAETEDDQSDELGMTKR